MFSTQRCSSMCFRHEFRTYEYARWKPEESDVIKEQIHITWLVCSQNSSNSELWKSLSPSVVSRQLLAEALVPTPRFTSAFICSPNRASRAGRAMYGGESYSAQRGEVNKTPHWGEESFKVSVCRRDDHSPVGCSAWRKCWGRPNEVMTVAHNHAWV